MAQEREIWDLLMDKIKNPYGVAALMGNLYAESSLDPTCCTGLPKGDKAEYIRKLDRGDMSKTEFSTDGVAFGLAQWRYWSRKSALYDFLGGINMTDLKWQIAFMLTEIENHYKSVWKSMVEAKDIQTPSDMILLRYEKPANTGESVKKKRAGYAKTYFDLLAYPLAEEDDLIGTGDENCGGIKMDGPVVITTVDRVLMRSGNGKEYNVLGRIEHKGTQLTYIAETENGWYAVVRHDGKRPKVVWISKEYSKKI